MARGASQSVGWIGLGKLGLPICRRLRAASFEVTVLARNEAGAAKAEAEGFPTCRALENLTASRVIVSAVPDDAALLGLMTEAFLAALLPGDVFIDISTVSPAASAEVARKLAPAQAHYLRAPVSGSTMHAASGQLTVMASGSRPAFDAAQPILTTFSARQFYLGAGEQARYLKLAINSILAANSALVAEALAIGEAGGLSRSDMLDVMTQSAIATPLLGYKKDALINGEYPAAFSVGQIMKDIDLVLGAARADHVPLPVNAIVRQRFEQAYADGFGESDFFCLSGAPKN
jgi:3-hydroxyisobutyrate dehydrogenase-like beta-hydroxyacid dehydrogenase